MCVAVLLAAGKSSRMQCAIPKQLLKLGSKALLEVCIETFLRAKKIKQIVVVFSEEYKTQISNICAKYPIKIHTVQGGSSRVHSVHNALEFLSKNSGINSKSKILIHDVARPYVNTALINRVIDALDNYNAVDVGIPVKDTIKQFEGEGFEGDARNNLHTLNRSQLYATQTPQGFRFQEIWSAHQEAALERRNGATNIYTDDITIYLKAFPKSITCIVGDENNIKITTSRDLQMQPSYSTRTGHGFDVHKFGEDQKNASIRICGIDVSHTCNIIAHSDGDVGIHALVDAIFGALAIGDIGEHFPPSNPKWKDTDSTEFLEYARQKCVDANAEISNVDITIICEHPKVSKYKNEMANKIAEILDISENAVNIKATTTEKLGFLGRGEGIAATACCIIYKYNKKLTSNE